MLRGQDAYELYINNFLRVQFPPGSEIPQWVRDALTHAGITLTV